ncbi:MAG: diaminopimelate decarboxylase [Phycisphaerales bacterium]|nr:diaminopimelate decarboxylase [Phycisphaerales bacterium]
MDHFNYADGRLRCEGVDLTGLASRVRTPTYVYSAGTLRLHYQRLREAFSALDPLICFSVKSCSNLGVLNTLAELGAGMDVVSGGELARARLAKVPANRIVFAGVGKTESEIIAALGRPGDDEPAAGYQDPIALFNVESAGEFELVSTVAANLRVKARAALRVNPDVDPVTHSYTTTGKAETKFGVDIARAREFFKSYDGHPWLKLCGVHVHLGSPVSSTEPYVQAIAKILTLIDELESVGHRIDVINIGGGFAADYTSGQALPAKAYADAIVPLLRDRLETKWAKTGRKTQIVLEPGRTIAANAGVLLTRVQYIKTSGSKKFLICDAGMHTLVRPALYQAFHFIWPTSVAPQHVPMERTTKPGVPGLEECDVVGPICETGDFLARGRALPPVAPGDVLCVFGAGAYGMSMASRYNSQPLPAEVLVDGVRARIVRRRETYADLVAHELDPEDIQGA